MAEINDRRIISSSSWWIWIVLIVGIAIVLFVIYGIWRLFRGATEIAQEELPDVSQQQQQPQIRLVRTPTEIIVIDDPIIPAGEVAVEDIVTNLAEYQGEQVTISGSVTDYESSVFFSVLQDEDTIGIVALSEVITKNELETSVDPQNQFVRVTGTVKVLTKEKEKKGFGFDFRNLDEAFWTDKIVIEADTIEVISPDIT